MVPFAGSFAFSPDGSKFAALLHCEVAFVYDVASLTRLAVYTSPCAYSEASWTPDGLRLLVSWDTSACVWDFSRPEAPSVVTAANDLDPDARIFWSPSGASYFSTQEAEGQAPNGSITLEERRAIDGLLIRSVRIEPWCSIFPYVRMSRSLRVCPDSHALLVCPVGTGHDVRVVVFG